MPKWWKRPANVIPLLLLAGAGLGYGVFQWVTASRWKSMGEWSELVARQEIVRAVPRVWLRPSAGSGNAWERYRQAGNAIPSIRADRCNEFFRGEEQYRADMETLVRTHAAALAEFERGAREGDLDATERRRNLQIGGGGLPYYDFHELAVLGVVDARLRAERGELGPAVDRWIDVLQFGRDLTDSGDQTQLVYGKTVAYYVQTSLLGLGAERIGGEGLERLERAFTLLLEQPPHLENALRRSLAGMGRWFHEKGEEGFKLTLQLVFQEEVPEGEISRRLILRYFDRCTSFVIGAAGIDSWMPEAITEYPTSFASDGRIPEYPVHPAYLVRFWRELLCDWLLLRDAVRWMRTGTVGANKDPWGRELRQRVDGGALTLWSLGEDGKDDGGAKGDHSVRARR